MGIVKIPLHFIDLKSELVTGTVRVGICKRLPVAGLSMSFPVCEFPVCAVKRFQDVVSLEDTFLAVDNQALDSGKPRSDQKFRISELTTSSGPLTRTQ